MSIANKRLTSSTEGGSGIGNNENAASGKAYPSQFAARRNALKFLLTLEPVPTLRLSL